MNECFIDLVLNMLGCHSLAWLRNRMQDEATQITVGFILNSWNERLPLIPMEKVIQRNGAKACHDNRIPATPLPPPGTYILPIIGDGHFTSFLINLRHHLP